MQVWRPSFALGKLLKWINDSAIGDRTPMSLIHQLRQPAEASNRPEILSRTGLIFGMRPVLVLVVPVLELVPNWTVKPSHTTGTIIPHIHNVVEKLSWRRHWKSCAPHNSNCKPIVVSREGIGKNIIADCH